MDEEERLVRINRLIEATGWVHSFALFEDLPIGCDGRTDWVSRDPYATIARHLSSPAAEATALHEAAQRTLGHEDDIEYAAAMAAYRAAGEQNRRGPWEKDADALAAACVEDLADQMTDSDASIAELVRDASLYP
jgi:hypothetical protein